MAELNRQEIERQQQLWVDNWAKMMVQIWQDKLKYWAIKDTGALMKSFTESVTHDRLSANIIMRFLSYGIYQAYGVGNGYSHNNGGDLPFLGAAYRKEHGLNEPRLAGGKKPDGDIPISGQPRQKGYGYLSSGEPRERCDWFNPKLYASLMRMKETMAHMVGEEAAAVMCEALEDARKAVVRR